MEKYFWLIVAAVWLANVVFLWLWLRLHRRAPGRLTESQINAFAVVTLSAIGGVCFLLAALQWIGGFPSPFCLYVRPLSEPAIGLSFLVVVLSWAAILAWVWSGNGAALVQHYLGELLRHDHIKLPLIRGGITFAVGWSVGSFVVGRLVLVEAARGMCV